jgi:nitrite reductase/ring-hydroxylating ferredoxin subunit
MTVGVVAAGPTALSGAADWADTNEEPRRIGLVHALLNSSGLLLMIASLLARRATQPGLGIGLSTLGLSLATVSAWLGGELVYRLGTGVGRIAFEPSVNDFLVVARTDELEEGKLTAAEASLDGQKVPIALLKQRGTVVAFSGACPHVGGPLAEGKLTENNYGDLIVECSWHASQFRLADGTACQGPAAVPMHIYDVRVRERNVEVRTHN